MELTKNIAKNAIATEIVDFPPRLPEINWILENVSPEIGEAPLADTAIVYIHHPLQTSINVVEAAIKLGAAPQNIFILGKKYSECSDVVSHLVRMGVHYQHCSLQAKIGTFSQSFIRDINWLWNLFVRNVGGNIKKIIVLDHGGHAINFIPQELLEQHKIIGVEKTSAGLSCFNNFEKPIFPIINVAGSAAKKHLESPLIAEAVVSKLLKTHPVRHGAVCGVIGLGAIGKAIADKLLESGHTVIVYDKNNFYPAELKEKGAHCTNSLAPLIANSSYIFGCSGDDISTNAFELINLSSDNKTFISCSSEDKEFKTLLNAISCHIANLNNPLEDITYKTILGGNI